MKPSEYLDKCKIALNVQSDYALAKKLEMTTPRISDYYKNHRWPDAYACARIALTLKLDPLEVLADIESQSAKTEARRAFWMGFIGRSRKGAAVLLLVLTCGIFFMNAQGGENLTAMLIASATGAYLLNRKLRIMGD